VRIEFPDTNDGKTGSRLVDVLEPRVTEALGPRIAEGDARAPLLHLFLTPDRHARLAVSKPGAVAWRNGIPRLRMPADAPSRSTLKLAEAFAVFLGDDLERAVRADMRAVDLGAAPGGWTWQFVQRGVRVMAIDNGPLKGDLVDNAMVKHLKMDGFKFQPKQAVDWMVCDMVEKPSRIASLVARWMGQQWCTASIFNLKLPMKKRFEEVELCRAVVADAMESTGRRYEIRIRQLYHDREEVTGLVRFLPRISHGASRQR
jgi:23S rRNA (cytidine2498-2'-O)-methyltransferase